MLIPGFGFIEQITFLVGLATLVAGWITRNRILTAIGAGMIAVVLVLRALGAAIDPTPEVLIAPG